VERLEGADLFTAAQRLLAALRENDYPTIRRYPPGQQTLFDYDPCRSMSERTCWACPLERCRRRLVDAD